MTLRDSDETIEVTAECLTATQDYLRQYYGLENAGLEPETEKAEAEDESSVLILNFIDPHNK